MGFFDKLKKINIFSGFGSELTDDFYDELEESLILADTGMDVTLELVEELRRRAKSEGIKTVEGADDFASLREVLERRLKKLGTEEEERFAKPQLIVIDGGKGQLSAVREIFDRLGVGDIDLVALAKQEEEIFTLSSSESVRLKKSDYALRTLQRIRDEAHRFAITYFRNLHSKRNLSSVLDEIEGVGKQKRIALLEKFKSIDKIMQASEEELCSCEGIGRELALRIREYFQKL